LVLQDWFYVHYKQGIRLQGCDVFDKIRIIGKQLNQDFAI
jgi:hypothetical protein